MEQYSTSSTSFFGLDIDRLSKADLKVWASST